MKKDDARDFIQDALLDPELELTPEELTGLDAADMDTYRSHKILDRRLFEALTAVSSRYDARLSGEETFRSRLQREIENEKSSAAQENDFFARLQRRDWGRRLKESFLYSPRAPYRLAPAAVLLFALLVSPLVYRQYRLSQTEPVRETALKDSIPEFSDPGVRSRSTASKKKLALPAPPVPEGAMAGGKPTGKVAADQAPSGENRPGRDIAVVARERKMPDEQKNFFLSDEKIKKQALQKITKKEKTSAPAKARSGDLKKEKVRGRKDSYIAREQTLLRRLSRAKNKEERREILQELEKLYKRYRKPAKLNKTRARLKKL